MNSTRARELLFALKTKQINASGNWITSTCPLAPRLHKNFKDENPSFGVSCDKGKKSNYNCFACGSGSLVSLLDQMDYHNLPYDKQMARELVDQEDSLVMPLPTYQEFSPGEKWVFTAWPEAFLVGLPPVFVSPPAMAYLESRGIPASLALEQEMKWDCVRNMVIFPLRDAYGRLAGARGRSILQNVGGKDKHYDYSHDGVPKNTRGVWYNEKALLLEGPVVVVEGQFDCLKMMQVWPKTVANLTAMPTEEKIEKLAKVNRVILVPDNDDTGTKSVAKYKSLLTSSLVFVAPLPPSVKDAGECSISYLSSFILSFYALKHI